MMLIQSSMAVVGAGALLFASLGFAAYPENPVSFIVSAQHNESVESYAHEIAEFFQQQHDTTVTVRVGNGDSDSSFNGAIELVSADADGYTVGIFDSVVSIYSQRAGITVLESEQFEPLGIVGSIPYVLIARDTSRFNRLTQLAEYANDQKIVLGHLGKSLAQTRLIMAYGRNAGFELAGKVIASTNCETFKQSGVDVMIATLASVADCLSTQKALAVISERRLYNLPNTPTLGELDPTLDIAIWAGLFVRTATPSDAKQVLASAARDVFLSERSKELASERSALVYWQDAEQAAQRINVDRGTLQEVDRILESSLFD